MTQQAGKAKTGDIVQAFKSRASERSIKDRLAEALKLALFIQEKRAAIRRQTSCNRATPIGIAQLHKPRNVIPRTTDYDSGSVAF